MMNCGLNYRECYQLAECIREDPYEIAELAHDIWVEHHHPSDGRSQFLMDVIEELAYLKEFPKYYDLVRRLERMV